jgi:N-hydroxyarylamine O-acetyltransferase
MTESHAVDLDAYFARIGYAGPRTVTVATLHAISAAHTKTIPFNNLAVLLGQPIKLDAASLALKLIKEGRGGYCFEQNGLLWRVLQQLGFAVTPLSARVRTECPRHVIPPRTHMFLLVDADQSRWLVDVGFGRQPTPHETHRIVREGDRYFHQALLGETWGDVYEFTLDEMYPVDQELANWWTSTSPSSRFKDRLVVVRADGPGSRIIVHNAQLIIRSTGSSTTRAISSQGHLLAILDEHFGLRPPPGAKFAIPELHWNA